MDIRSTAALGGRLRLGLGRIAGALLALFILAAPVGASAEEVAPSGRVTRNVVVRAAPSTTAEAVARLLPGEGLPLLGQAPGWYRVRLPDGRDGFVSKSWTVIGPAGTGLAARPYRVHVIDVGTGLAVFAEGPGFALLYDAGSQDDLASGRDNRVVAYIRAVRPDLKVLDHVVLSHPHKDHLELMPDVFDAFEVRHVWESGRVNRTAGYCRFLKKVVAEPGVTYHDAIASHATRTVSFSGSSCGGDVQLRTGEAMSPAPVPLGTGGRMSLLYRDATAYRDPNGNSVVVRLDLAGRRVLLTGDAEGGDRDPPSVPPRPASVEGRLLACCAADLAADVLVVGHHGSLTSSRDAFVDAVGARTFVISSGPYPYQSIRLPDAAVIDALRARGAVFTTTQNDATCGAEPAKPGPDTDESPGGCDNVRLTVTAAGVEAVYVKPQD